MLTDQQVKSNRAEILTTLARVKREGIDNLVEWYNHSDFFEAPASAVNHGNFKGGLAAHCLKIYHEFSRQVDHYKLDVDSDAQIIASLCHDACKIGHYKPNILKDGKLSEAKPYVGKDIFPLGHGEKSVYEIGKYIRLTEQEAMLIRWHMGPFESAWREYADKIEEHFPEVIVFHHVDHQVSWIYKL